MCSVHSRVPTAATAVLPFPRYHLRFALASPPPLYHVAGTAFLYRVALALLRLLAPSLLSGGEDGLLTTLTQGTAHDGSAAWLAAMSSGAAFRKTVMSVQIPDEVR